MWELQKEVRVKPESRRVHDCGWAECTVRPIAVRIGGRSWYDPLAVECIYDLEAVGKKPKMRSLVSHKQYEAEKPKLPSFFTPDSTRIAYCTAYVVEYRKVLRLAL